ncbi:WXG100 family type VII secretion target [Streptoalloteichus hindustanus]|uniref:Proteins of 100 residues with WXG n=1 Tax=Streptoalloteichus hindustanus TaxID=2017 RepID=A0A1M5A979_STRHI|nr:WXG100 family type VII secretion target [Streptoalloteichus hindustanus]SHF26870.1 Proteins of 100 residues with WXG [Streptoalloteichus hindustanus]
MTSGQQFFERADPWQSSGPKVDAVDSYDKAKESISNFQDASSLPEVFVAGVGAKRDVQDLLSHPMQSFWDNGLGFLVEWCMTPFRPLFEQVTGDPEQMRTTGAGWEKMAEFVNQLADQDAREQEGLAAHWEGPAAQAQAKQKEEFQQGLRSLADCCKQLKEHLDQVADFFEGLWDILVDIVREFVEGLIITWLAALATSAISFGASVAAAWATSVARVSITLSRILMAISKALRWLVRALQALKRLSTTIQDLIKAQNIWVRAALKATGVTRAVRTYGDPMRLVVKGATGLTGMKAGKTAMQSGSELATDQALTEAGEYATGKQQRNNRNQGNMERGFTW